MKLSKLISKLQNLQEQHGDLEVTVNVPDPYESELNPDHLTDVSFVPAEKCSYNFNSKRPMIHLS